MRFLVLLLALLLQIATGFQVPTARFTAKNSVRGGHVLPLTRLESVTVPFHNDTMAFKAQTDERKMETFKRIQRSAVAAGSCVTTWMLAKQAGLSIVQASSFQGLAACTMSPAFAAASFCGSFAGMSGQLSTILDATVLGSICGGMYYLWDANKIGVGKGGRLGTIAFLSNLIYFAFRNAGISPLVVKTLRILGPATAAVALMSGTTLHFSRAVGSADDAKPTALQKIATAASKMVLLASVSTSLLTSGNVAAAECVRTAAVMFLASMTVKMSPGVVLPVALVGLASSFALTGSLSAQAYLGAFIGMTSVKYEPGRTPGKELLNTAWKFLQSSVFSAVLFNLGLFDGFGGKLGFLSFLGVVFGM